MSELGTVPRKSLVARFAENKTARIATKDSDCLSIEYINGNETKNVGVSLSTDFIGYPMISMTIHNSMSSAISFQEFFNIDEKGIAMTPAQLTNGQEDTFTSIFSKTPAYGGYYGVSLNRSGGGVVDVLETENCTWDGNFLIISDPSKDAYAKIKISTT